MAKCENFLFFTYFVSHNGPCAPKEKWHRKEHIIITIIARQVSNTLGSFSFSRPNLSHVCFASLILFRQRWKVIISKSWSLPMSAAGKLWGLAMFAPDWERFLTSMLSIWLSCCPFQLWMLLLDALWWPTVSANTRSFKVAKSSSLSPLYYCPGSFRKMPHKRTRDT